VAAFIDWHLNAVGETTASEYRFALGSKALCGPGIDFFTAWEGDTLVGMGALKDLGRGHAEVKSMRTEPAYLRKGVGAAVLASLIVHARTRGIKRLSLETGTSDDFAPAHALYRRFGFTDCAPFAEYPANSPHNRYMTLAFGDSMPTLVLIRHGQSQWNLENRFTGWWDVDVTEQGAEEARTAGRLMRDKGLDFDLCFTSLQSRAIKTLNLALEEMGRLWLPVEKDWRLNERHYGGLTGLDKAETAAKHGDEQVKIWRRSFDIPPPPMEPGSAFDLSGDRRYAGIAVPSTESLKDTIARVLPYWYSRIAPELAAGKRVLISAHGNSLRALVKHLSGISDADITGLEIPTGQPIVYDLADDLSAIDHYYLSER
jgi:2,3-bisphosphoglycerate-dependent phosphoglycerate mutase